MQEWILRGSLPGPFLLWAEFPRSKPFSTCFRPKPLVVTLFHMIHLAFLAVPGISLGHLISLNKPLKLRRKLWNKTGPGTSSDPPKPTQPIHGQGKSHRKCRHPTCPVECSGPFLAVLGIQPNVPNSFGVESAAMLPLIGQKHS